MAQYGNKRGETDATPDKGCDRLWLDTSGKGTGKGSVVVLSPPCTELLINFSGKVTQYPTGSAMHIVTAFGRKFYVDPAGHGPDKHSIHVTCGVVFALPSMTVQSNKISLDPG